MNKAPLLTVIAFALLVMLIVAVTSHIHRLESDLASLRATAASLRAENTSLAADSAAQVSKILELEQQIDDFQRPTPVGEPGVFPITRVLARSDDTVERMAEREGTDAAVIYGLNPWLNARKDLERGQPIWVPIRPKP